MEFVNLYQSHAELVVAQNQLLNSIDKSGSFESISFIRRDEREFTVVFNYTTRDPLKINLKVKRYIEDGTKMSITTQLVLLLLNSTKYLINR